MRDQCGVEEQNPSITKNQSEDRNAPITSKHGATYIDIQPIDTGQPPDDDQLYSCRDVAIHTFVAQSWDKRLT